MHMNCICRASLKMTNEYEEKQHGEISIQSDSRSPVLSCWSCGEKQETDNVNQNGPSRAPSLTSTNSTISCSSDVSVDTNPCSRGQDEGSSDSGREDLKVGPNPVNGIHQFDEQKLKDSGVRNGNCTDSPNSVFKSAGLDTNEDEGDSFKGEMDAQVWLPPEAEDPEEDAENSVVSYDDDEDECDDGTKWSKTSSFSSSGEEGSGSYRFREEKQKAMDEVMNGKFKALVGQLLNSIGVSYLGENGESWVDIVTSLSWEAASFVKPEATQGKPMDPDGYVKIKCVATGSRSQSQVIRGLVFKKHAAHKHMPTKYVKPRLLLIRGALGLSSSGLSSFESMQQEKDSQKSIVEMIEMSHPNVILVEKTVPRDIQESILARGMTLVFEMKLHRLERVARCTGSSILSSDILAGQKLKHCDSFHFEKFTEEHNKSSEAGKKPSRTLMFIEGCPTRLGCTILLKGTHSDELKRIKCVMQCAVVMAYHLILETSFLLDQSAMFSTIPFDGVPSVSPEAIQPNNSKSSHIDDPGMETICHSTVDIPISEGFHGGGSSKINLDFEDNSPFLYEPYNPVVLSGLTSLSVSLKKAFGDSFPQFSSSPSDNEKDCEALVNCDLEIKNNSDEEKVNCDLEIKSNSDEEKAYDEESSPTKSEDQKQHNGNISTVLDSESILVLMSSRNASRGTICEQSHLSHIKFYRNFDVPLGKFLQENLLNQKLQCSTCSEPPEAHFFYYAHHNKQLTIQVRHLPIDERLPGESVGKLWMWSRCGKCKSYHNGNNGHSKSTKRVLISTAARGLSFGKFLELSFSNYSSFSRLSSCGHSLHRDFLYFFGLGRMVAMMRYSQVRTYSVSLPPLMLEINHSIREELLKRETAHLHSKAMHLFDEVEKSLGDVASRYSGSTLKLSGKLEEFSDVEEILKQERSQFEINLENAVVKSGHPEEAVYKLLSLNRFLCDLLLESCIWDQRLYALLSTDSIVMDAKTVDFETQGKTYSKEDEITVREADREINVSETRNKSLNNGSTSKILQEESIDPEMVLIQDIPIEGSNESSTSTNHADDNEKSNPSASHNAHSSNGDNNNVPKRDPSHFPLLPASDSMKRRAWTSFLEFREEYLRDLHRGFVPKFDIISSYTMECFPNALGLINEEGPRLHIPLGTDEYMVTDFEDELSSIIACALALLKDPPTPTESLNEDANKENRVALVKVNERSANLMRISSSVSSAHWSSNGSFDPDGTRSPPSLEESRLSSFDGLNLLDSLVSSGALHPEVSMGFGKSQKGKYSVLCSYANQFQDLRNRCCPSEPDYIASLSRCRNWDAKGGKSKSFFAKTLDDRFIIKEIKKTEFESFTQFAPDYFRYMNECYENGNQTCLAKILGIYQVTIRQTKSGKEVKHDLMVMENLSFGRNITRQYDLKGALHARFTLAADGSGDVLLDQNFVNDMNASPLYVGTKSKRILERSVWNDTTFLNSINVMDYSLLVSVDAERHELVCGIIDYLRQYTWDKQLETWVKSSLVLPKNQLPTIVSPREYKKRFRKFMTTYFLTVPDHWCLQRSSNPCKLCGMGELNDYPRFSCVVLCNRGLLHCSLS